MKSKEEVEKWMRDEVSNPIIGKLIMDMTEDGLPMDEILEIIKPLVDNTPNVEAQLVEKYMKNERIEDGDIITSKIEELAKIAEENGFETSWSIDTISPVDSIPLTWQVVAKWMIDGEHDVKVELPNRELTGLELWKYADELYKLTGDTEHRFIEDFTFYGDTMEVFFGS